MRAALSRCCALGVVFVACAVLAVPAFADPSVPTGLTATARNDHSVDLSWTWPSPTTYPDDLQLWRNGAEVADLPLTSTAYTDSPPNASTTYTYQLVTVNAGVPTATPVPGVPVTTRADAPNAPTAVAAAFAPATNIATVTFTRGAEDSDVTYNVLASLTPGGAIVSSTTVRYANVGTAGSVTLDGFTSYTSYVFSVVAVEDAGDPPSDPGQTTPGTNTPTVVSNDVTSPSFNGGVLSASRTSLGSITAIWPGASDSGTGVASYTICVDGGSCQSQPFDPLASTQSILLTGVPNDGQLHSVSVIAIDGAGNASMSITGQVSMPVLAAPQISFAGHTDGCGPLIPVPGSTDGTAGAPPGLSFQLFANGQPIGPGGSEVTGTPFAPVTLTAQASFASDVSALSPPAVVRINDPDGPATSPSLRGQADSAAGTETLSWDPITADGAPVDGYQVTANIPGYQPPGQTIPQSSQPQVSLTGLSPNVTYVVNVNAYDRCGRLSPQTPPFTFIVNDQTPPSVPTGLTAGLTGKGTSVHLSWAPSTDNVQVGEYNVLRNGQKVWTTSGTSFDDPVLPDATTFTYRVVAVDTSGNPSAASAPKQITTRDLTPPGPPGNPHATQKGGIVTLTWSAASDNVAVTGYQVSRNGHLLGTVAGTTYVDGGAPAGTNEWEIVAVDAAGNQSAVRTASLTTSGAAPTATKASALTLVRAKGVQRVRIGGRTGARVLLVFKLTQQFAPAVLRVQVLSGKATLRVSLPTGTGRTTAGKRLGQRAARKGTVLIAIGTMHPQTLKVVLTSAKGGVVTLAGPTGARAPTIVPSS